MASKKAEPEFVLDDQTRSGIAKRLRQELKRHGIKQVQVATTCNVSRGAVNNWVKGRNVIHFVNLYVLGRTYPISVDYILFNRGGDSEAAALAARISKMSSEARKQLADMFGPPAPDDRVEEYGQRSKR